jgi:hypothetical protein
MKIRRLGLLFFLSLSFVINGYAVPTQKKMFGDTTVVAGTSTKNIMPLLANIAGRQGKYFREIYGQYRSGFVIVNLQSNGKMDDFEQMEKIGKQIIDNVKSFYRSAEGVVRLFPAKSDIWQSIYFEFKNGTITNQKVVPSKEEINRLIALRKQPPKEKFGLSEQERRDYWNERDAAEDRALKESQRKYPSYPTPDILTSEWADKQGKQLERQVDYELLLLDKYKEELLKKFNITKEQAGEIIEEGYEKGW